jgi:thiosulfate/3-mercaptopyruvate sulfurtransferase
VNVLIDATDLAQLIEVTAAAEAAARTGTGHLLVILDVRWALGMTDGHDRYLAGHLPGAVFVDLEHELAGPPSPAQGRHPLPDPARLQDAARRWGLSRGSRVVVYDDGGAMSAARAWWLLRWAGLEHVLILDGGLAAWRSAGLPLETGEVSRSPGDVALSPGHLPVMDADEVAAVVIEDLQEYGRYGGDDADVLMLDARAGERYRGEIEPVDPVAGHIPGALSAPTAANLDGDGRFLDPDVLHRRFLDLGVGDDLTVVSYCGSGVTAAHQVAALAIAGFDRVALYPGSWSQWCADPRRPVATGDPQP